MSLVKCTKCKGEGYLPDPDFIEEEMSIPCPDCEASGYVEKMPF